MSRATLLFILLSMVGCTSQPMSPRTSEAFDITPAWPTKADGEGEGDYPDIELGDDDDDATARPMEFRRTDELFGFTEPPGDVVYLPGEFEPADSMMVAWTEGDAWEARLVAAALPYIKVRVVTPTSKLDRIGRALFIDHEISEEQIATIDFITEEDLGRPIPTSVWMRDFGPLAVVTQDYGHRLIDFAYYDHRPKDDGLPTFLGDYWGLPVSRPMLQLEGGNIQSNGRGTCVVSQWAVTQNVNAFGEEYGEGYVKQTLGDYLGCETTIIVPRLAREGTGHVDMYVHITGPDTVLVGEYTTDQDAANKRITDEGAQILADAGFTVTRIPMPTPTPRPGDEEVFRSYTNALAVNDGVLVPTYRSDTTYEERALEIFQEAYPTRTIVTLPADDIIVHGGAIHCSTMSVGNVPE